jgi:Zn-dependent M28 family amino/carboxypeptidase
MSITVHKNSSGDVMQKISVMNLLFIISLAFIFTSSSPARKGNAESITAARLQAYLSFIASDELEGRDTPSRGLNTAAKFIASHLSRWGLEPIGDDGTYFQRIALRRSKIDPAQTRVEINGQSFRAGEDFLAQPTAGAANGPLVYAGQCWMIKAKDIKPNDSLQVKDKIIVAHDGLPKGVSFRDLTGKRGEDWESPSGYAKKRGASGVILVPSFRTLVNWERNRRDAIERGAIRVEKFQNSDDSGLPVITASANMINALFRGEHENGEAIFNRGAAGDPVAPFDFDPAKQASFTVAVESEPEATQNVVAVLEGSDRVLKNEYVAIGAHYDHVGIGRAVAGDSIYNGADDDGSGTVAVLAIAEAFARGPRPKRSILFVWHAGEEHGLWGSRYITEYPVVPLDRIIAQLNIDMIGRSKNEGDTNPARRELSGPHEIYMIGSKLMSTELGALSETVNKSYLNLTFNYKYDDPGDPNRFFFRSDHYNYAQKGIPIIFYFDGLHEDYHRPSDSFEKIDYQKLERVTRTIYATAWELANRAKRPAVNKPLPAALTAK